MGRLKQTGNGKTKDIKKHSKLMVNCSTTIPIT